MTPTPNPTAEQPGCSNPKCPLRRAHSGPCAPEGRTSNLTAEHDAFHVFENETPRIERSRALNVILKSLGVDEPTYEDIAAVTRWADAHVTGGLEALRAHGLLSEGAPSAERGTRSKYISPSLPGMIRNLWKDDPSENSVRTALKLAGDLIQELIDLRAADALEARQPGEDANGAISAVLNRLDELNNGGISYEVYSKLHDLVSAILAAVPDAATEAQVEAAAKAMHGSRNPWFAAYGDWGAAGFEIKKAFRGAARAALVAAGVAPQAATGVGESAELPTETPASWGVGLDPEKVAEALEQAMRDEAMLFDNGDEEWIAESDPVECLPPLARALCAAYTEGKLT